MKGNSIFDQLTNELGFAPFDEREWPPPQWWEFPKACPICGDYKLVLLDVGGRLTICDQCWQCNKHLYPAEWHCAECGVFLKGFDRCQIVILGVPGVKMVCRKHYEELMADADPDVWEK